MATLRSVRKQKTVRGFTKAVKSQGGYIETGGRHPKFVTPDGKRRVPYPAHTGDMAKGTAIKIAKSLIGLGFICLTIYISLNIGILS